MSEPVPAPVRVPIQIRWRDLDALAHKPPASIVNTHTHEDHIGANGKLQAKMAGLVIQAHPLALPVLADPQRTQPLHPYRRLFWGWPAPSRRAGCSPV